MGTWFNWQMVLASLLCVAAGYLLGGIDFAIIVSKRLYKKDVRELGSGNAGMTNILRNFGKKGAVITLVGDVLKGMAAVGLGHLFFFLLAPGLDNYYGAYMAGLAAVIGHMFPAWFGFKGGKGVSVSGGVILALQPLTALILIAVFLVCVKATGMVSLGSVVGISLYPVVTFISKAFITHRLTLYATLCSLIVAGLVVYMHRENIQRIRAGTEYRFGKKGKQNNQKPPAPDAAQTDVQAMLDED